MKAKEYLSQAFLLNEQINTKLEQVSALRHLATKTCTPINDMPGSPTKRVDGMEETIIKMVSLENEINADIDKLVDLKVEITRLINKVSQVECRLLLEKRYLCMETWEVIAVSLNYNLRYIHKLHSRALSDFDSVLAEYKQDTKRHYL